MEQSICEFCHDPFFPARKWARFCSSKCRNNFHNDNKLRGKEDGVPVVKCPHCLTDDYRMFEEIRKGYFLCNVCAKEFRHE